MNTITLHHILPYLPFGLEAIARKDLKTQIYVDEFEIQEREGFIMKIHTLSEQLCGYTDVFGNGSSWFCYDILNSIKPLLYSLDDYRDHSSKQMIELFECDFPKCIEVSELAKGNITPGQCSYAAIQAMAEAHIDMFSLIPAGLAVKKEPLK